jgi:hypothetical protein
MHDLVRGYAAGQARQVLGEAGIRAAIERSLDHYLHTVIRPLPVPPPPFAVAPSAPGVLPEQLADEAALQDWARAGHRSCSGPSLRPPRRVRHPRLVAWPSAKWNCCGRSASPPAPKAAATVYRMHVLDGQ